jgi:hypothetical protein
MIWSLQSTTRETTSWWYSSPHKGLKENYTLMIISSLQSSLRKQHITNDQILAKNCKRDNILMVISLSQRSPREHTDDNLCSSFCCIQQFIDLSESS